MVMMKEANILPEETFFIDDSAINCQAAIDVYKRQPTYRQYKYPPTIPATIPSNVHPYLFINSFFILFFIIKTDVYKRQN